MKATRVLSAAALAIALCLAPVSSFGQTSAPITAMSLLEVKSVTEGDRQPVAPGAIAAVAYQPGAAPVLGSAGAVQTVPARGNEVTGPANSHRDGSTVDFVQMTDGGWAIKVQASFWAPRSARAYETAGYFRPTRGTLTSNGGDIFWIVDGHQFQVGHHYGWTPWPYYVANHSVVHVDLTRTRGPLAESYVASVTLIPPAS